MPEPPYAWHDWTVPHGDSRKTPPFALVTGTGEPIDLEQWTIRAQLRARSGGALVHTFSPGTGILVGSARLDFADGRPSITTSTVRLAFTPADFDAIPRKVRGRYDVEISRGTETRTVVGGDLDVVEDVSHD